MGKGGAITCLPYRQLNRVQIGKTYPCGLGGIKDKRLVSMATTILVYKTSQLERAHQAPAQGLCRSVIGRIEESNLYSQFVS